MLRRFTLLVASALTVGSCGPNGSDSSERDAGVYAAVIEAVATESSAGRDSEANDSDLVVFAGSLDEDIEIPLDVQASVVETLEDVLTVRFVDQRSEAIDQTADDEPVLENGVLVLLGAIPSGPSPTVRAERYANGEDTAQFNLRVEPSNGHWTVVDMS